MAGVFAMNDDEMNSLSGRLYDVSWALDELDMPANPGSGPMGRWGCRTRSTRSSPKGIGASTPGRRGHRTRRMPLEWPRGSRREPMIPGQDCSPGIAIRFRRET